MTSLHYEMLEILLKRVEMAIENENTQELVYTTTGSSTIDKYLLDIVNGINFSIIRAKIKSDFKSDDYADALVYVFQQINDNKSFNVDDVFSRFNRN